MKKTTKNMLFAFILNLFFAIVELVGGIFTNSISIISDAIHDFGDSISIGAALAFEKHSEKKPDKKYTYGYMRYSLIGALITSVVLLVGSALVVYNAIDRIITPAPVNYNGMIIFAIFGIIVNGAATFITSHGHNLNEKALSLHMLEDVLGWAVILIGSIVIKFTGWHLIDPIMSLGIAVFIFFHAFGNIKEVFSVFLEKAPEGISVEELEEELSEVDGVTDIHHIHLWSIDGNQNYITLHAVVEEKTDAEALDRIRHELAHKLEHEGIHHSTIQLEHKKCECEHCHVEHDHSHGHHHHHGHSHGHHHH